MDKFETVIIGGGPGGLSCALTLAHKGRDVLLIEKEKSFCSKTCGGGVTPRFHKLGLDIEKFIDVKFKNQFVIMVQNQLETFNPEIRVDLINRKKLGDYLKNKAQKYGARIKPNISVISIKKDYIVTSNGKRIGYKYLVGADGSSSIVRRYAGLGTRDFIILVQYKIQKKFKKLEWCFDARKFDAGYGWIFPHSKFTSIGTGNLKSRMSGKEIRIKLDRWVSELGLNPKKLRPESAVVNADYRGYKFGNIFLVGDAAGFTPPLTCEGMYPAIVSGREVAKMIINPKHSQLKIKKLVEKRTKQQKLLDNLNRFSFLRNFIYNSLVKIYRIPFIKKKLIEIIA